MPDLRVVGIPVRKWHEGARRRLSVVVACLVVSCGEGCGRGGTSIESAPAVGQGTAGVGQTLAPNAAATAPAGLGPASARSRLVVVRQDGGGARPTLVLGRPAEPESFEATKKTDQSILVRELVRQSVLIAARDGLGLATRDEVIGDAAPPSAPNGPSIDVASLLRTNEPARILIARSDGKQSDDILRENLPVTKEGLLDVVGQLAAIEPLSRQKFPEALKRLGIDGSPIAARTEAPLPEGTDALLSTMSIVPQFEAVRNVHEAMRTDGESPQRLGALVRGYAHLGVLTEHLWFPAHKVFKARSLLYAQRLVASNPESPVGLWHRAYAEALAGLHANALADLAKTREPALTKNTPAPPAWVALIEASCRYDLAALTKHDAGEPQLAALLRLFAVEYPSTSSRALKAAGEVLALCPACFRACDAMCQVGGVSNLHTATLIGPQLIDQQFPRQLSDVKELPAAAGEPLDKGDEVALTGALAKAGTPGLDTGEPSWAVLGRLIREIRFVIVWRRMNFMRVIWSVPADEFWADVRHLVADHPCKPYLEWMVQTRQEDQVRVLTKQIHDIDLAGIELTAFDLTRVIGTSIIPRGRDSFAFAFSHGDSLARDLARNIEVSTKASHAEFGRYLLTASPYSPFAMATLIENDWEFAKSHADDWEKSSAGHPSVLGGLGRQYSALHDYDKAEPYLRRYIEAAPEYWAYMQLANNYKAQGNRDRWKETIDEFLDKGEDHGLDGAQARVAVANDFMDRKEWAKARPYAEAAAATWAEWAMQCAHRCAEGNKDWDRAEFWIRNITERYTRSGWARWYLFCVQSGHGNAAEAQAFTEQYIAAVGANPSVIDTEAVGFFHVLSGQPKRALDDFRQSVKERNIISSVMQVVLVADELHDEALRDATLKALCTERQKDAPKTVAAFQMFRDALAQGATGKIDLEAADKLIASTAEDGRGNIEYFVAYFLMNRGDRKNAATYFERASASPQTYFWMKAIATATLRGMREQQPLPANSKARE